MKIIALSLMLIGSVAQAATLAEITERALARNPEVQMRLHEYNAAGEEQQAARGSLRPRLDLDAYAGRERYDPSPGTSNYFNHPGVAIQLRQLLFDGGSARGEVRRLGYTKATRYFELLAAADDIGFESARAYLDVQRYRQLSLQAQENWGAHKEVYEQIASRVQAGVGRRVDLEQASGRLALAQSNWLTETSNLHDVGARFQRIVGEAPPVLAEAPDLTKSLPEEKSVISDALRDNPSFMAAVSNLRAARAQTDVRRSTQNSPTVEFRASTGVERNRNGFSGNYNDAAAQVVMNYNLFKGGSDSARLRQANEQYSAAVEMREKACREVRQTTTIGWNNVRKLREQLRYLDQHLLATEKARDAYRQQFDIGQRTLLDLLDTENELFQARRAYANAQYDLRLAEYQVLTASHRLLPGLGLAPSAASFPELDAAESEDAVARCGTDLPAYEPLDLAAAMAARPTPAKAPLPAPSPAPVPATIPAQCEFAVQDWAAAWSAKDLKKYMGYYSNNFEPLTRADREDWRRFRAERLDKENISVEPRNLSVKQLTADTCEANFRQRYRSSDFNDDVDKRLVLKKEANAWRIIQEIAPKKSSTN
ncbi:TolC family outer membrane protein [Uliginosibacterium aquaticum]|uniref:TolC family outer membrane protein n=1 Tax=Uliginosibacterium aquaticum TaxID=2731212 RepID=A0ABX2II14_9RHOO|nr:TolC family outer membrane protein [Uliginosibacterium aquaticum]NSL54279.1 TolC family outer membrane protein [Uliginosibacterium aquaticum]